jgi:polyhydroxyalkanoate synthesis regulator phasin
MAPVNRRWLIVATIVLTLAFTGGGVAVSGTQAKSSPTAKVSLVDSFFAHLAKELGVTVEQLRAAFKKAATATVDDAVKSGTIDAERAAKIRAKIASGDFSGFRHGSKGHRLAMARLLKQEEVRTAVLNAAAKSLGMSSDELLKALKAHKRLRDIAAERNVSKATIGAAIADALKPFVDKLVADGKVSRKHADKVLAFVSTGKMVGPLVSWAAGIWKSEGRPGKSWNRSGGQRFSRSSWHH